MGGWALRRVRVWRAAVQLSHAGGQLVRDRAWVGCIVGFTVCGLW